MRIVCPYCGFSKWVEPEKIPSTAKAATCPRCGQRFSLPDRGEAEEAFSKRPPRDAPQTDHLPPWERRDEFGLLGAILRTAKEVLFSPQRLFKQTATEGRLSEPLAFGLLFGSLGMMFGLYWDVVLGALGVGGQAGGVGTRFGLPLLLPVMLVAIPVFVLVSLFVLSTVIHILLRIMGAGAGGFQATFRVMAYGQAAQILAAIPLAGGLLSSLWFLFVQVVGLRQIHRTSYPRVIIAMLLPLVLLIVLTAAVLIPLMIAFLK